MIKILLKGSSNFPNFFILSVHIIGMYEGKCPFFKWIDKLLGKNTDSTNTEN